MELKLFTTPQEEMELQLLRQKISKLYALAFKQIELAANSDSPDFRPEFTVYDICNETIKEANDLAQKHLEKWKI